MPAPTGAIRFPFPRRAISMKTRNRFVVCIFTAIAVFVCAPIAWAGEPNEDYAIAAGHFDKGWWQKAADSFGQFVAAHPQDARVAEAYVFRGESLVTLGQFATAGEAFAASLKSNPQHQYATRARFRVGEAAFLTGEYKQAIDRLADFHKRTPKTEFTKYALNYLGQAALNTADYALADAYYQEGLQQFPSDVLSNTYRYGLAQSLQAQGDPQAIRFYTQLLKHEQFGEDARLQIGSMHYRAEEFEKAIGTLQLFRKSTGDAALRTSALYYLAMAESKTGLRDQAMEDFTLASATDDQHPQAAAITYALAEEKRAAQDFAGAETLYRKLTQTWPTSEFGDNCLQSLIISAYFQKQYAEVNTLATEFVRLYPDSPYRELADRAAARSLLQMGQFASATPLLVKLTQANQIRTQNDTTRQDRLDLARAHHGQQQYADVLAALKMSAGLPSGADPIAPTATEQFLKATSLVVLKRYEEAIPALQSYLMAYPDDEHSPSLRTQLAIVLATNKQWEALADLYPIMAAKQSTDEHYLPTILVLAEQAYAANERKLAGELFADLAREENPANYVAKGNSGLAWCRLEVDGAGDAAERFARVLKDQPDSPLAAEAAFMRARLLSQANDSQGALEMYQLVLTRYADSTYKSQAMLAAAQLLDESQREEPAAELFAQYVKENPQADNLDGVLYRWAWVEVELGRNDQADRLFERLLNEHPDSSYWTDTAYRLAERTAPQDPATAELWLDRLLQKEAPAEIRGHALYLKGQLAADKEQWPQVVGPMQQLLEEQPNSPLRQAASYWIAEAHYRQRKYDQAGLLFDSLAEQTQQSHEPWLAMVPLRRAQVLAHKHEWESSREIAATIAADFPDFRRQYEVDYLLGRCWASQADFDFEKAREAYQRVLRSPVGGRTETAAMAQWMIGETFFLQKNHKAAIDAYERVDIKFDYPKWQAAALLQSAKCHEVLGRYEDALLIYAHILKQHPNTRFTPEATRRLSAVQKRVRR